MDCITTSDFYSLDRANTLYLCASDRIFRTLELSFSKLEISMNDSKAFHSTEYVQYIESFLNNQAYNLISSTFTLSPLQELVACKRAIDDVSHFHPEDLSTIGLAKRFRSAIKTLKTFNIDVDELQFRSGLESGRFLEWYQSLNSSVELNDSKLIEVTHDEVIEGIRKKIIDVPKVIVMVGFIHQDPKLLRLINALEYRGCIVYQHAFPFTDSVGQAYVKAPNEFEEAKLAAAWLKKQLRDKPMGRFAMVVPEVDQYRDVVESALNEAFELEVAKGNQPFVFAGGKKLLEYPMVADALNILTLLNGGSPDEWSRFILSQYTGSASEERTVRASIDRQMRFMNKRVIRLSDMEYLLSSQFGDTKLCQYVSQLRVINESLPDSIGCSRWAMAIQKILSAAGWIDGLALSSYEHQTQAAFLDQMSVFSSLDDQVGKVRLGAAIGWLREIVNGKRFEPESSRYTPILILSHWDSLCVQFDAAWVMGLDASHFPRVVEPTSFIPLHLQQAAGVVEASYEVATRQNKRQAGYLSKVGLKTVCSYAQAYRDMEQSHSPYFAELAGAENIVRELSLVNSEIALIEQDDDLCELDDSEKRRVKGITTVLKDVAQDNWLAQIKHRFSVKDIPSRELGITPATMGTVFSAVQENFWIDVKDQETLKSLSPKVMDGKINNAITSAFDQCQTKLRYLEPYEKRHLALKLMDQTRAWLEVELARTMSFRVVGHEIEAEYECEGQTFKLFIDRIDEVQTEHGPKYLVLDYKTGADIAFSGMLSSEIKTPQLLVYLNSKIKDFDHPISGLAFAHANSDKMAYVGVSECDLGLGSHRSSVKSEQVFGELVVSSRLGLQDLYQRYLNADITKLGSLGRYDEKYKQAFL